MVYEYAKAAAAVLLSPIAACPQQQQQHMLHLVSTAVPALGPSQTSESSNGFQEASAVAGFCGPDCTANNALSRCTAVVSPQEQVCLWQVRWCYTLTARQHV